MLGRSESAANLFACITTKFPGGDDKRSVMVLVTAIDAV